MISFAYTEEQNIARRAVASFAETQAKPAARAADEASVFPADLMRVAWDLGLVQAAAAEEAPLQPSVLNALVIEEAAYGDATLASALAAPLGFVRAIAVCGAPEQRRRWLPAFTVEAPRFAAVAHAEAGWPHRNARKTRARRTASGWRLEGVKAQVPLAARCAAFVVTADTEEGRALSSRPARRRAKL